MKLDYKVLLLSNNKIIMDEFQTLTQKIELTGVVSDSSLNALSELLDNEFDLIILDYTIGEHDCCNFMNSICDDYALEFLPVVLLTSEDEEIELIKEKERYKIISVVAHKYWQLPTQKLLEYLKLQKTNIFYIQNSIIENRYRGTLDEVSGAYKNSESLPIFHTYTSRLKVHSEPFCMVLLDIDRFEELTQNNHQINSEIMRAFAALLLESIRKNDLLVQYDDTKFLLFLSNLNIGLARKVTQTLRTKINKMFFTQQNFKLTSSVGVIQYKEHESFEGSLERLEQLIQKAQESGGDAIVSQ
jgi:diguanylate cyclase (GGDEF)-like protein